MKILLLANTDWYLYNFRRDLALELQRKGYDLVLVSPPGDYVQRLSALGFRWLPLAMERSGMNPFKELRTFLRLFRLYRAEKPDLVHHFTVKCVLYGSLAARWSGVASVVNSVPGLGYTFMEGRLPRRALRADPGILPSCTWQDLGDLSKSGRQADLHRAPAGRSPKNRPGARLRDRPAAILTDP